jgi:hypothetical protein
MCRQGSGATDDHPVHWRSGRKQTAHRAEAGLGFCDFFDGLRCSAIDSRLEGLSE